MTAYYNEIDPYAAEWLRNLIAMGHIAPGVVDERSIEDVTPYELREFTQCHFFAGIGVWSLALRNAGWPDDRPIWTGSCPCQPFSTSGKQSGFADERHLWPHFHWLIQECKPAVVVGEQVASKAADPWIDLVQADLEALEYGFGAVAFPSASIGAPHIRDRKYWVGYTDDERSQGHSGNGGTPGWERESGSVAEAGVSDRLADSNGDRREREKQTTKVEKGRKSGPDVRRELSRRSEGCTLDGEQQTPIRHSGTDISLGAVNGFWRDADWLGCRDGKWRPVEPGTFPLVNGATARVGRLRAYGNAINAEQAKVFIETVMDSI